MLNNNPTYSNRVRYILRVENGGQKEVLEPEGWRSDSMEFSRHDQYHGIFPVFSENLKFVDEAAEFIKFVDETYGIQAKLQILKEQKHPTQNKWLRWYTLDLDMSTMIENEDDSVSIKINASGIEELIKNRDGEKTEIERLETMDGQPMGPIPIRFFMNQGRKIFLVSKLKETTLSLYTTNWLVNSPPLTVTSQSDEKVVYTFAHTDGTWRVNFTSDATSVTAYPQNQQFFYLRSDRAKTIKVGFDIKFKIKFNTSGTPSYQNVTIGVQKAKYIEGETADPDGYYTFIHEFIGNGGTAEQTFEFNNIDNPIEFDLEEDDCLCYLLFFPISLSGIKNFYTPIKDNIVVSEDSEFPQTWCRYLLAHELVDRQLEIMTSKKNLLYSKALGLGGAGYSTNGFASLTAFAHGHWIRGFDKAPVDDEENRYKPFSISFKDTLESLMAIWNVGLGIEKIGYSERVRIEDLKWFYQMVTTIKLPYEVTNYKEYYATEKIYNGVEVGYEKGGEYEEAMGLDEPNGKSNYTSVLTRVKNAYKAVSKVRTDNYGPEFARRKSMFKYPTTDTSYDSDVWAFHLKEDLWNLRKWQDDFAIAPKGIYSPETAYNLMFSLVYLIKRHGWRIAAGLLKYPNEYLTFGSSSANSNLETKLIGGTELKQNVSIKNSDLERARDCGKWMEFEHPVDFDLHQKIIGTTKINGEDVPNLYGLVEFKHKGVTKRGFLFNLKPNDKGVWKLLKANI